jgi:hypothetical protein
MHRFFPLIGTCVGVALATAVGSAQATDRETNAPLVGAHLAGTQSAPTIETSSAEMRSKEDLARQYLILSHREGRLQRTYSKQIKLAFQFCAGKPCQGDLEHAVDEAVSDATAKEEAEMAHLLAERLTEADLRAALTFVVSPSGQAIIAEEDGMDEQLALVGHTMARTVYVGLAKRFCPAHQDTCQAAGLRRYQDSQN